MGPTVRGSKPASMRQWRMKVPKGLLPLIDDGVVDSVIRQLKSGKEAAVFLVACGSTIRCAKVYKDANHRSFHKAAEYQEGRKARNSRDARAMSKRTPLRPPGAGGRLEERRGRGAVPARRRRRARAAAA